MSEISWFRGKPIKEDLFNPEEWIEITRTEYKNLKKTDCHNVDGYTARIKFKYFKLKLKEVIKCKVCERKICISWEAIVVKENIICLDCAKEISSKKHDLYEKI